MVSNVVTPVDAGPNATMYGLKFTSSQGTFLNRSAAATGTISYWEKSTATGNSWQHRHQTNANFPVKIGDGFDGILSDYYFVDGRNLPEETFVDEYNGKTIPLDRTVIKANVGDFGTEGFYLPFNPNASGLNYENTVTTSSTYTLSRIDHAFDGDLNTKVLNEPHSVSTDNFQTIIFAVPFTDVTSVKFYGFNGDTGGTPNVGYRINTEAYQAPTNPGNNGFDWQDLSPQLANTGNTVSSVSVKWDANVTTDSRCGFRAIEINGELLLSYNGIGLDDSGNGNDFQDNNFLLSDSVDDTPMKEWLDARILDADDPDDVEKFYAIKAALVQYESERIDFQQLMVDALVAAGFTTDQIAAYIDE